MFFGGRMKYTLMHKDTPVAEFDFDEKRSSLKKILGIFSADHMPPGSMDAKRSLTKKSFLTWWSERSLPKDKANIDYMLSCLCLKNLSQLKLKGMALSLQDCYWMKKNDVDLKWKDVNFFDNGFTDDVANVLYGMKIDAYGFDLKSPENTTAGYTKKYWKYNNGNILLYKSGTPPYRQQPLNDAIFSEICSRLNIDHVEYDAVMDRDIPLSVCNCFTSKDIEFIPAVQVMRMFSKDKNDSDLQHYVKCCENLGVKDTFTFLSGMFVVDRIMNNDDRNYTDFGLLRDSDTREFIKHAPLFGCGNSLGYYLPLRDLSSPKTKWNGTPFAKESQDRLYLLNNMPVFNFDRLESIEIFASNTYGMSKKTMNLPRINAVISILKNNIEECKSLQKS